MIRKLFIALFLFPIVGPLFAQEATKPDVLIVTTGGTIASNTNAPMSEGHELIRAVPELTKYANIDVEEFVRIGSSKMTPAIWLSLVKRINERVEENPNLGCIIITHGTDTMEETAFFLNLTHRSTVPIVLVGSMRSSNEISADGPANLLNALRVGISEEAIGKGVLVVLNENISAGRDLIKSHNRRVDAFASTERGFIGSVDPEKVVFYSAPTKAHTIKSEFNVYQLASLPPVDIVQDYAGLDSTIFSYYKARPNQGLVISSFAGGRVSNGFREIFNLPESHKPIVIASSIKGGRIMGSNREGTPIVVSNDLPANKARILLMLALTKTKEPREIQQIFDKY